MRPHSEPQTIGRRIALKVIRTAGVLLFLLHALPALFTLSVGAEEGQAVNGGADAVIQAAEENITMPDAYTALPEALPDGMAELLPDGLFSNDPDQALSAVGELTSLPVMVSTLLSAIGLRLGDGLTLLGLLVGMILLAAVFRTVKESVGGQSGRLFGFCMKLCLYGATVELTVGMIDTVTAYFDQLTTLTAWLLPVMGTLFALGGNVTQAAVSEGILLTHLSAIQYISAAVTPPVCGLCMALSLLDGLNLQMRLSALTGWIKKTYTAFLGLVMFLLSAALGSQTILSARADSLRMKGIKYAVGSMLPVVGGAVSGTLGTVAAGISTLRSACGVCGIILIALLLLPALVQLLLMKQVIHLSAVIANFLNCDGEAHLLDEIAGLYGYLAAAVSICSVITVLTLGILAGGSLALANA